MTSHEKGPRSRVDLDYLERVYERSRQAIAKNPNFTMRATARLDDNMHFVGRAGRFQIECDEPKERGGTELAPAPLHYFVAGLAFCFATQVVKFSPLYGVPIHDLVVDARGEFSAEDKYDLGGSPGSFDKMVIKVKLKTDAAGDKVRSLIEHAERGCHASQTVQAPVPVELDVSLNSEPLTVSAGSS